MNRLKSFVHTITILGIIGASTASFSESNRFVDHARVVSATPIYKTYEHRVPRESCWMESVKEERPRHRSATSTIVGGIIGGAIGNAVGAGDENKKVGAVVGSLLGMSIGNDIGRHHASHHNHHRAQYKQVERCEVNYEIEREEKLTGYDVKYHYRGETYQTQMDHHPGKKIRVAVQIQPLAMEY